jgi:hypothetical protein
MTVAFAWGAFWIGCIAGPVAVMVLFLTYFMLTDEEMVTRRLAKHQLETDAKETKARWREEAIQRRMKKIKGEK